MAFPNFHALGIGQALLQDLCTRLEMSFLTPTALLSFLLVPAPQTLPISQT